MLRVKQSMGLLAGLLLGMLTFYLILKYAFVQPYNLCRMTFMMEPPKFLVVPIDYNDDHHEHNASNERTMTQKHYKLFMYSEFNFPQSSNPQQDLKDSMPVLFVPGNAGSYQQARSLASTCIRRQLRSLEAAKFIFYTVSFGEQLSGISGKLLIEQIDFVARAIKQIKTNHPDQIGGIILIGHSVGGFISKAIFTQPNFPRESVGLIISLAGPLTGLPLFFDNDVRNLYEKTNQYWNKLTIENDNSRFVALSISGGYTDRLVPPHLAMDPNFDISITTSALSDVWLPTDHVPITWCRELIRKLSIVMSSVMDKRTTRLVSVERQQIIETIKAQLIGGYDLLVNHPKLYSNGNWSTTKSFNIMNNELFYHDQRYRLQNELKILNLEQNEDLFILIEHVENLPHKWITGCDNKLQQASSNERLLCTNQIELSNLARSIPSRYYEPQISFLVIPSSFIESYNILSIVIDLVPDHEGIDADSTSIKRMPESFSYQRIRSRDYIENIYLPTLFEYIWHQLLSLFTGYLPFHATIEIEPGSPLHYMRFYLPGFKYLTQTFMITLDANSCIRATPDRGMILFRAPWSFESYHSPLTNDDLSRIRMNLRLMKTFTNDTNINESAYLELFIDGNCKYDLNFRFNFLDLFNIIVQHRLGSILTCLAMLLIISIKADSNIIGRRGKLCKGGVKHTSYIITSLLPKESPLRLCIETMLRLIINIFSMGIILATSNIIFNLLAPNLGHSNFNLTDEIIITLSIYTYCSGAIIASRFILRIFINLATKLSCLCIVSNSRKDDTSIGTPLETSRPLKSYIAQNNGYEATKKNPATEDSNIKMNQNDWPLIKYINFYAATKTLDISGLILILAIILGVFWCSSWLSLAITSIFLMKSVRNKRNSIISIEKLFKTNSGDRHNSDTTINVHSLYDATSRLDINILLLTVLCVIPTIPNTLISLQDRQSLVTLTTSKVLDHVVFISILALIIAYIIMNRTFEPSTIEQFENIAAISKESTDMHVKTIQNVKSLFFLPVLLIESNIYFLSVTQLTTLLWLACT